jgi:hypothetical protein
MTFSKTNYLKYIIEKNKNSSATTKVSSEIISDDFFSSID